MLVLKIIDNGLGCDCGVCRAFVYDILLFLHEFKSIKTWLYYLVYYIWCITKNYYFPCVQKTIKQIHCR